jgi:hypothetical protein
MEPRRRQPRGTGGQDNVDLLQFSDWLSSTPFSQAIQVTSWAIPGIQTVHLIALALTFTAALVLTLRFAGFGLAAEPLPQLAARYTKLICVLVLILLASGALLIIAEPGRTIRNPAFYAKMIMLALALGLTLWLSGAVRRQDGRTTSLQTALAVVGLLLWIGIIFAGRFIAYIES